METFSALLALCAGNSPVPVNSPHKGQWRGALMSSFIYAWINDEVNNREAGDLRRQDGHYDVIIIYDKICKQLCTFSIQISSIRDNMHTIDDAWCRTTPECIRNRIYRFNKTFSICRRNIPGDCINPVKYELSFTKSLQRTLGETENAFWYAQHIPWVYISSILGVNNE